jgi:peroxin-4
VINGKGLGSGYDGGRWLLDIRVPDGKATPDKKSSAGSYPNAPPEVRFVTRIVAPNVGFEVGLSRSLFSFWREGKRLLRKCGC